MSNKTAPEWGKSLRLYGPAYDALSDAQKEAALGIKNTLMAGHQKIFITMPTQTGKTGVYLWLLNEFYEQGLLDQALIQTPMKGLVKQIMFEMSRFAPGVSARNAYQKLDLKKGIQGSSVAVGAYAGGTQALLHNIINKDKLNFIILDEGHKALSDLRQSVLQSLHSTIQIAISASPSYSKQKNLCKAGYVEAYRLTLKESVERGFSPDVRNMVVLPQNIKGSLDDISFNNRGDYDVDELDKLLSQEPLFQAATGFVKNWKNPKTAKTLSQGTGIVFCNSVHHARMMAKRFNKDLSRADCKRRIPCVAIWGDMPERKKDQIMRLYKAGKIMSLACADYLIHGYSYPKTDFILNLRPTRSGVVAEQRGGRALANDAEDPDKEALIVDFVFPAKLKQQLLYADVVGGALFRSSARTQTWSTNPPVLEDLHSLSDMKFHYTQKEVLNFIRQRNEDRNGKNDIFFGEPVAALRDAMKARDLKAFSDLQSLMTDVLKSQTRSRAFRNSVTEKSARDTIYGAASPFDAKHAEYTPTAIILAAVFNRHPKDIFGKLPETLSLRPIEKYKGPKSSQRTIDLYSREIEEAMSRSEYIGRENPETYKYEVKSTLRSPDANKAIDPLRFTIEQNARQTVSSSLGTLRPREERILRMHFGIGGFPEKTFQEIGECLGNQRERIRQIEITAMRRMSHPSRSKKLRNAIDFNND